MNSAFIKGMLSMLFLALVTTAQADRKFSPHKAEDINPAKDIVEVVLVAGESEVQFNDDGPATTVWSYNGMLPGPMIEARLGDTLIVHFYNQLPEPTTIHWHGLELPANMDGSFIAQNPVPPGGYFRYEFKLLRAATFWYHPHIRSNEQVEKGLYGALIVRDRKQDKRLHLPRKAHVLMLDDILLDEDGSIAAPFPLDPLGNAAMQVNGREGNVLLVNGEVNPTVKVKPGKPQRLRLVNTSNSRFMRVSIPHHTLYRIGGDAGLLEQPVHVEPIGMKHMGGGHGGGHMGGMAMDMMMSDPDPNKGILLTPGERADVIFIPHGEKGDTIPLQWHDIARGRHTAHYDENGNIQFGHAHNDGHLPPVTMMTFKLKGGHHKHDFELPAHLAEVEPVDITGAGKLMFMFGHTPANTDGDVTFFVQMKNGMMLPFDKVTPADAPVVRPNETYIIEVHNMTGGDHNFHLHGFMFQHIETQFIDMDTPENNYTVPAPRVENKDTILLPRRTGMVRGRSRSVTRLAITFDDTGREGQIFASGKTAGETTSGGWLLHCHILEHSNRGMTSFIQVVE